MAEYIEREALLKWAREFYPNDLQFASAVINAPAADVAEVQHGEWIGDRGGENRVYDDFKCSICGKYTTIANRHRLDRYCGNCGAKMF